VKKVEDNNKNVEIDNEWGITVSEDVGESKLEAKTVVDKSAFSLDDLKGQLGDLYKKK